MTVTLEDYGEYTRGRESFFTVMKVNSIDNTKSFIISERFSSLRKLLRVTAYVFRFLENTKGSLSGKIVRGKGAFGSNAHSMKIFEMN